MLLPVRAQNVRKEIECDFIAKFDNAIVTEWSANLTKKSSSAANDAVEFCENVAAKWAAYEQRKRIVRSEGELFARCEKQPEAESLGVIVAQAPWYAGDEVLAFCEFRRTWSNNIVFDFLAVRPDLLTEKNRPISGLGVALLYRLSLLARALDAQIVWAETTDTSVHFYKAALNLKDLNDLLVVDAEWFYKILHNKLIEAPGKKGKL